MCGVAGYAGTRELPEAALARCLQRMHHRGPDDGRHQQFRRADGSNVYLLHSRLSIIDLDARANQPLHCGTSWIAFNGELYNYLEVRADLEALGESFSTESDTEVLVRTITRLGWDGLDRCEGMWAFAVYDESDQSLTLSRDRFGEKPLYLHRDQTGLYFGSEAKFVFDLLGHRALPDLDQVRRFLVNGYKALYKSGQTFFEGLTELAPATLLRLDADGREQRRRYWRVPCVEPADMTYEEAVGGTAERLTRSVQLRLRSDVPLAFCLSGGVDSNGLVGIAKRVFGYDVHGFTIVNSDARYEEQELVEQAVAELGLRHTPIPVDTRDFLPRLRTLVRHHDAPVYTITYYAHWLLQEAIAASGYRISVSGTAADELFSGYFDHHLAYLREVRSEPALFEESLRCWREHVLPYVRNPYLQDPERFVRDPGFRDHIYLNADEFASYLADPWQEAFAEADYTSDLLRNRMLNELFAEAVPVILHEDDLNAMYYSVENRSPYLDRALFEFALTIPTKLLVREGRAKAVLRDALAGVASPAVLSSHRKVGFNAPIESFLDVDDPQLRKELLADGPIFEVVRKDRIRELLDKRQLPNSESKFLFSFVSSKLFLEEAASA